MAVKKSLGLHACKLSAQINLRQTSKGLETVLKHIEHNFLLLKLWELGDQFPRQVLALFAVS